MEKIIEVVIIKANSYTISGADLYWLLSRQQLEFIFKDIDIFEEPPYAPTAQYRESMLPVISLEEYYGLQTREKPGQEKYLVVRAANDEKGVVKLIVETPNPVKIHRLESGFTPIASLALPRKATDVLGIYGLSKDKIAVVPDLVKIQSVLRMPGRPQMVN